jgi:gas vesicle protein
MMTSKVRNDFIQGALKGILLGGSLGVALALLLTPYSGKELRKQVSQTWSRKHKNRLRKKIPHTPHSRALKKPQKEKKRP